MKFGKANFQGQISGEDYNRLVTNIALNSFRIEIGRAHV